MTEKIIRAALVWKKLTIKHFMLSIVTNNSLFMVLWWDDETCPYNLLYCTLNTSSSQNNFNPSPSLYRLVLYITYISSLRSFSRLLYGLYLSRNTETLLVFLPRVRKSFIVIVIVLKLSSECSCHASQLLWLHKLYFRFSTDWFFFPQQSAPIGKFFTQLWKQTRTWFG